MFMHEGNGTFLKHDGTFFRTQGGVVKIYATLPFYTSGLYNTFPDTQTSQTTEYCEIFWTHEHVSRKCPIMKKYTTTPNTIYYDFFSSTNHSTNKCIALDAIVDGLDWTSFKLNENPQGPGRVQGGGVGGGFIGGINGGRGMR
jgi:hypothetical protein